MKKLQIKKCHAVGSQFEALGVLGSKNLRKQNPIFTKKWGSVFFQIFIQGKFRSKIVI